MHACVCPCVLTVDQSAPPTFRLMSLQPMTWAQVVCLPFVDQPIVIIASENKGTGAGMNVDYEDALAKWRQGTLLAKAAPVRLQLHCGDCVAG